MPGDSRAVLRSPQCHSPPSSICSAIPEAPGPPPIEPSAPKAKIISLPEERKSPLSFSTEVLPPGKQTHTRAQTRVTHGHTQALLPITASLWPSRGHPDTATYQEVMDQGPSTEACPGERLKADLCLLPPPASLPPASAADVIAWRGTNAHQLAWCFNPLGLPKPPTGMRAHRPPK